MTHTHTEEDIFEQICVPQNITSSHVNVTPPLCQIVAFYSLRTSPCTSELNAIVHLLTTLYRTISKRLYDVCYVCWLLLAHLHTA